VAKQDAVTFDISEHAAPAFEWHLQRLRIEE
jgi:hypothetical protein